MAKTTQGLEPELKKVLLSDIVLSKTNPRKTFDEDAISELAQSIKEKEVVQPILLRPYAKGKYELVCGERRYRASKIAAQFNQKCKEIPAYIRDLTDDEVIELQLTENLQRKDVHPMEDASSFAALIASGKTVEDIATIIGKQPHFIRQRIKLTELIPIFQKAFFHNCLTFKDVLRIAGLTKENQEAFCKSWGFTDDDIKKHANKPVRIKDWQIKAFEGVLSKAPFDLNDASLVKKAGACNVCPFNSAVSKLFPDADNNAVCGNASCYKEKQNTYFDLELKTALEDATLVMISSSYGGSDESAEISKKHKVKVLDRYEYDEKRKPEPLNFETFKEVNDHYENEEQLNEWWEEEKIEYEESLKLHEQALETGKICKAFIVDGANAGHYAYIKITKKSSSKTSKDSGSADIDSEISRISDRLKRGKELDREKVQVAVVSALKEKDALKPVTSATKPIDQVIGRYLIFNAARWDTKESLRKELKIKDRKPDECFECLANLTDDQMSFMVRSILLNNHSGELTAERSEGAYLLRSIAIAMGTIPVDDIEAAQKLKADKREANGKKKIDLLKAQKKETAAATKKPVTKKKATVKKAPVKK